MISTRFVQNFMKFSAVPARNYSKSREDCLLLNYLEGGDSGITTLSLNRPKQKNAFNADMVSEFNRNLDQIRCEDRTRVLIIRSIVPGIFCAGADLKERLSMPSAAVGQFVSNLRNAFEKINKLQFPVIAALDGLALGGGLELALACDIRIASSNTKLGLVEGRLAIIPGAGGTQRLPRLINPSIAKELIYTCRVLTGDEAFKLGLVNHSLPQNDRGDVAFTKSLEVAQEILPNGAIAVKLAKVAIDKGLQVDLSTGLSIEEACYAQLIPTSDRMEGLKAFDEKRKPKYTGQ